MYKWIFIFIFCEIVRWVVKKKKAFDDWMLRLFGADLIPDQLVQPVWKKREKLKMKEEFEALLLIHIARCLICSCPEDRDQWLPLRTELTNHLITATDES